MKTWKASENVRRHFIEYWFSDPANDNNPAANVIHQTAVLFWHIRRLPPDLAVKVLEIVAMEASIAVKSILKRFEK